MDKSLREHGNRLRRERKVTVFMTRLLGAGTICFLVFLLFWGIWSLLGLV